MNLQARIFRGKGRNLCKGKAIHFSIWQLLFNIHRTQNSLRNPRQVTSTDNKAHIIYLCNREQLPVN